MNKTKTNLFQNIDSKVYLTLATLLLLSLIIFSFQYSRHINCKNAKYIIHSDEFTINRVVEFYDNTKGAKSWKWDFRDSTAVDFKAKNAS